MAACRWLALGRPTRSRHADVNGLWPGRPGPRPRRRAERHSRGRTRATLAGAARGAPMLVARPGGKSVGKGNLAPTLGSQAPRPRRSRFPEKGNTPALSCPNLAERVGFEPTVSFPTHDFQSCRFGRSRTPPALRQASLNQPHAGTGTPAAWCRARRSALRNGAPQTGSGPDGSSPQRIAPCAVGNLTVAPGTKRMGGLPPLGRAPAFRRPCRLSSFRQDPVPFDRWVRQQDARPGGRSGSKDVPEVWSSRWNVPLLSDRNG